MFIKPPKSCFNNPLVNSHLCTGIKKEDDHFIRFLGCDLTWKFDSVLGRNKVFEQLGLNDLISKDKSKPDLEIKEDVLLRKNDLIEIEYNHIYNHNAILLSFLNFTIVILPLDVLHRFNQKDRFVVGIEDLNIVWRGGVETILDLL